MSRPLRRLPTSNSQNNSNNNNNQYEDEMNAKGSKDFRFYMPMGVDYLEKSLKGEEKDSDPKSWKIGGIASSDKEDLESDIVLPGGIDFSYYLKFGLITWDHLKGPENKIGIPTKAEVKAEGLYTEGYLLKDVPAAVHVHTLMKALASGPHERQMQWSIEGKTILQEGKRIIRSWIKDITLTMNGINTSTYAEFVKSLQKCKEDNSLESMPYRPMGKTLDAGYQTEGQTGGDALRVADLESRLKILTNKSLTYDEAIKYAMMKSGSSPESAKKIIKYAQLLKNLKEKK